MSCASAGTLALPDQPASGVSIAVARDRGLDLGTHSSRALNVELAEWADHILTMTSSHRAGVEQLVPRAEIRLLTDFLPPDHPDHGCGIPDPIGGDRETYDDTYEVLEQAIRGLFDRLTAADAAGGDSTCDDGADEP